MMANDMKHVWNRLTHGDRTPSRKLLARALAIGAVTAATLFGVAPIHAADQEPKAGAKAYVQDSVITTKIKAKLAGEKISTLAKIKVDTDGNGAVVLSGDVKSQAEADKAVQIAQTTEGVTSVQNQLQIKPEETGKS